MTIAIFGNTFRPSLVNILENIFQFFAEREDVLLLDDELYGYFQEFSTLYPKYPLLIQDDDFQADIALSIGGDGTFLSTAARIGEKNIPIMGINIGRLGFLTDVSAEELPKMLQAIVDGEYAVEERTMLKVIPSKATDIEHPYALNDVSIFKQDSSSMLSINTYLNDEAVHSYHADGLVVATPTGSTAYSMSVGGPVMVPQAHNIILSPIASHSLTVRPLVIPDDWKIDLDVISRSGNYLISLDGRTITLSEDVKIRIEKADFTIKVARQLNHTFFDSLKSKLMWGLDKRN